MLKQRQLALQILCLQGLVLVLMACLSLTRTLMFAGGVLAGGLSIVVASVLMLLLVFRPMRTAKQQLTAFYVSAVVKFIVVVSFAMVFVMKLKLNVMGFALGLLTVQVTYWIGYGCLHARQLQHKRLSA